MPDCNSGIRGGGIRVKFVGGGGNPLIWIRDVSKVFSNVSQRNVDSINI